MDRNEKKHLIYNLMLGDYDLQALPDSLKTIVRNEMATGTDCEKYYSEIYAANRRLCERLGVEEDKDVEAIISNLLKMSEEFSLKMFDYGSDSALLDKIDESDWGIAFVNK